MESVLKREVQPETIVEVMLSSPTASNAASTFATEVLLALRSIERKRAKDSNQKEGRMIP